MADTEAIAWAYSKLNAFGVGNSNMDSAMMMDRLNLMLSAAPTPPAPQNYEEQPDGTIDPADTASPAQEADPVAVVVKFPDGPWGEIHSEYRRTIKPGTELYTRPQSDNLRKAAEEALPLLGILAVVEKIDMVTARKATETRKNLRAALEGKS